MIVGFPVPFPDELFYSVCARYSDIMNFPRKSRIPELLFRENACAIVDFPIYLDIFSSNLPPGGELTAGKVIKDHSLLPYYSPFYSSDRIAKVVDKMKSGTTTSINTILGIGRANIRRKAAFSYCPLCVEDDRINFEYCYWHREHQLPGVLVCYKHKVFLEDSSITRFARKNQQEYISAEKSITDPKPPRFIDRNNKEHSILLTIAEEAYWLLNNGYSIHLSSSLNEKYLIELQKQGFASQNIRVKANSFLQAFEDYYSKNLLSELGVSFDKEYRKSWPVQLMSNYRTVREPLYHILLIQFLGHKVDEFLTLTISPNPFGEGPWPCLNPVCENYRKLVINECKISFQSVHNNKNNGYFSRGVFECTCGYCYSRIGPDRERKGIFEPRKILQYGFVWDNKLKELWNNPLIQVKTIARKLGVSVETLRRQVRRLGLKYRRPGYSRSTSNISRPPRQTEDCESKFDFHKNKWMQAMLSNPNAGVNELVMNKEIQVTYTWLYNHERDWLFQNSPSSKVKHPEFTEIWQQIDNFLPTEVRKAAERVKGLPGKPIRITKQSIRRELPTSVQRFFSSTALEHLPKTIKALEEVIETKELSGIRRIQYTAKILQEQGVTVSRAKLIFLSGVPEIKDDPVVSEAIDHALKSIGRE